MANDCYFSELKGSVDNSKILRIGELRIGSPVYTSSETAFRRIELNSWSPNTNGYLDSHIEFKALDSSIRLPNMFDDGNMSRTEANGGELKARLISTTSKTGKELLSICKYYNLVTFYVGSEISVDFSKLRYCENLREIGSIPATVSIPYVTGKLSEIVEGSASKLVTISLNNSKVEGDPEDLANCINLTQLTVPYTLQGDWYSLIVAQRAKGRTTGKIKGYGRYSGNFNGTAVPDTLWGTVDNNYLEWTTDKAIYYCNGDIKSVMCIGYSDSEIATNTASGGIWYGFTVTKCD